MAKIISIVLASRLQSFMDQLINPFQKAFIKGCHILDNFYTAHVLTHHLHSSKLKAALLKIDFERAFDHVNWNFLLELLEARGFGTKWIGWIKGLLCSTSTVVLLNGAPGTSFTCKRGPRQEDPLSPIIFIFSFDVLFRMLQLAAFSNYLHTIGVGEVKLQTLQFADNILLFFDGSSRSAAIIKVILGAFSESSGLGINYNKSTIFPIHMFADQASDLANSFGCSMQCFPLSYLGLPLSPERLHKTDYLPLIEKIDIRLAGWNGATLSRGGCLVLFNSVLTIPKYFSSTFLFPAWFINAIDKIRRGFFWRGKKLNNGFRCLVKWEHICRPKRVGGIGIRRNLHAANAALLMKCLWNFYNFQNLPWVELLMQKHYKRRTPDLATSIPSGSSPIWRGLLKLSALFFTSVNFSLGNGKLTLF